MSKKSVAFIGLGIMGRSMAGHIQAGGHQLHVYNRSPGKAPELVAAGAVEHASAGEAAAHADVVITIVGLPKDVEEVYFGKGGIIEKAKPGAILIDMTTSSPTIAKKIADAAKARGLHALDAPVSGGDVGAKAAKLSIMVGGDKAAFDEAKPIFDLMGTNVVHQGGPGAGQHTKMVNQIVISGTIMGVCEALAYGEKAGLDLHTVLSCIGTGAAGGFQLNMLGPKAADGDFRPGFMIEHFMKDMGIALAEAKAMHLDMKGVATSFSQFEKVAAAGGGREATQALIKVYRGQV